MGDTPFFESELFAELSEDLKASSRFTATYRIKASDYEAGFRHLRGADGRMSV